MEMFCFKFFLLSKKKQLFGSIKKMFCFWKRDKTNLGSKIKDLFMKEWKIVNENENEKSWELKNERVWMKAKRDDGERMRDNE